MKPGKVLSILLVMICCFLIPPAGMAADKTTSESGGSNPLMDGLMSILQESIDEFIGNYKGRLGDVRLIERRGNKVVLEVTYDNVKRSDNVYVQGEVRQFGNKLEGFSNTLSSVSGSHGKAKLVIGWTQDEDDGWGTVSSQIESDQIRLFLVRESNPDRPFGEIIYDMAKVWTNSDEPDEESMVADSGSIELEDDETVTEDKPVPPVFIKPGTVLTPHTPGAAAQIPQRNTPQRSTPGSSVQSTPDVQHQTSPATQAKSPALATPVTQNRYTVQQYDFYSQAKKAKWRSSSGQLTFPGKGNSRGFARCIQKGKLNSGNAAIQLLETHPEFKAKGWIDGHYPHMILGNNLRFKSVVGFLEGASDMDDALFKLYVKENNKYYRAASTRVSAKKYMTMDADLSQWAGKKVQLVLRVQAGSKSTRVPTVWVKPRLTK